MVMMGVMGAGMMHRVMRSPMVMRAGGVTFLSHRGPRNDDQHRGEYSFLQHNKFCIASCLYSFSSRNVIVKTVEDTTKLVFF